MNDLEMNNNESTSEQLYTGVIKESQSGGIQLGTKVTATENMVQKVASNSGQATQV